jgi:hypothetical protein
MTAWAPALLESLIRDDHQIRQDSVAEDSAPPSGSIRPANPALAFAFRLRVNRCFQFVDAVKELPTLSRRQCLHLLQNLIRTHRPSHTTNGTLRANSKRAFSIFFNDTTPRLKEIGQSDSLTLAKLISSLC